MKKDWFEQLWREFFILREEPQPWINYPWLWVAWRYHSWQREITMTYGGNWIFVYQHQLSNHSHGYGSMIVLSDRSNCEAISIHIHGYRSTTVVNQCCQTLKLGLQIVSFEEKPLSFSSQHVSRVFEEKRTAWEHLWLWRSVQIKWGSFFIKISSFFWSFHVFLYDF